MTVRAAHADDAGAVSSIFDAALRTDANCCDSNPSDAEWAQAIASRGPQHWFAVDAGPELVRGWAQLKPWAFRPRFLHLAELVIYVAPGNRSRTTAADLIFAAIEHARAECTLTHLVAVAVSSNQASVRGLSAAGFVPAVHLHGIVDINRTANSIDWFILDLTAPPSEIFLRWRRRARSLSSSLVPTSPSHPEQGVPS